MRSDGRDDHRGHRQINAVDLRGVGVVIVGGLTPVKYEPVGHVNFEPSRTPVTAPGGRAGGQWSVSDTGRGAGI